MRGRAHAPRRSSGSPHFGDVLRDGQHNGVPLGRQVGEQSSDRYDPCRCGSGKKYKHFCFFAPCSRLAPGPVGGSTALPISLIQCTRTRSERP
ncbi:MAG: SEC-C domain-containing protein [Verrucomicrobia bacterium]|nr:SEC-C domain-containing protein [Verrucomicrobiota bacterium]